MSKMRCPISGKGMLKEKKVDEYIFRFILGNFQLKFVQNVARHLWIQKQ